MQRLLRPLFTCGGFLPRTLSDSARLAADFPEVSNPFDSKKQTDLHYMFEAYLKAMEGVGITAPNPTVGCVIVKDATVLSKGATEAYRFRHAERVAFESLKNPDDATGATAYVTLEPCAHVGHQPACSELLSAQPINRVVVATTDPNPKVSGKGLSQLQNSGKSTTIGPLEAESRAFNLPFFFEQLEGRPLVVAKWAQTLDGCLCDDELGSQWITGPVARSYTHWLRQKYDLIVVGAGTVLTDAPTLTARDCAAPINRQPLRAFFDPNGRILHEANQTQRDRIAAQILSQKCRFIYVTKSNTIVTGEWAETFLKDAIVVQNDTLEMLASDLHRNAQLQLLLGKPLQSLMIEGGPRLLSALIGKQMIDLAHIFIAPVFFGGTRGRATPSALRISEAKHWTLVAQERLGQDVLLECMPSQHSRKIFESR